MTSKAQKSAGYLLPDEITGHDLIRVCLCIPDDAFYRAAFRGAIYELTKPWNWQALDESEYPRQHEAARYWTLLYHEYLKMPCNICELIAECLENLEPGSALYDALQNWLAGQLQNNPAIKEILDQGGSGGVASPLASQAMITQCDQSLLFGFTRQLVQQLNRMIVDLYEILEVYTNFTEFLAAVTSETSFLGASIEYVEKLQDTFMENYQANYTVDLENEYSCDLLCLALRHDCQLTWEMLTNYFLGRFFIELGDNTVFDILSYFVSGVWTGAEFCHLSMAVICSVLHFSGEWLGLSLVDIQNLWNSWLNDPDPDWSVLCDCGWMYAVDFTTSDDGWALTSDFASDYQGVYVPSVGWRTTWKNNGPNPGQPGGNDSSRAVGIAHALSVESVIVSVQLTYDLVNSGHWDGTNVSRIFTREVPVVIVQTNAETDPSGTDKTMMFEGHHDSPVGEIVIKFLSGRLYQNVDPGGQVTLTSLVIYGTGDNPFE